MRRVGVWLWSVPRRRGCCRGSRRAGSGPRCLTMPGHNLLISPAVGSPDVGTPSQKEVVMVGASSNKLKAIALSAVVVACGSSSPQAAQPPPSSLDRSSWDVAPEALKCNLSPEPVTSADGIRRADGKPIRFLACAMFRTGDKLASYGALAAALALVRSGGWTLTIIGDGPRRTDVKSLFSAFGDRVTFLGALASEQLAERFANRCQPKRALRRAWRTRPGRGPRWGCRRLRRQER